ncbi:MAG: pyridoxal-phosphate dependent enzyme [Bacteroidales bacterium]|nr:pyridoxal-phosphate dependent enzyme [Bacteroidales bacterium]MDG2080264.1 pyridoxal-phosphate dependent enzyme [Bacteroidales bacterium]
MLKTIPSKTDILEAHKLIKPFINQTPVLTSKLLDELFHNKLYFKCENFQKAGSFKSRGAVNAIMNLSSEETKYGVATHSSGNFAQALARAAMTLNIEAYIVMPNNAPKVKVKAVEEYGGKITFCEPNLKAREETLSLVINNTGATELHPYDDYDIIAGQGTAALELCYDVPEIDLILCPVGGGGLISGTAISANYFGHNIQVIGCEPDGADDAFKSYMAGEIIPSINPNTIADGLLTSLGKRNFPIIMKHVKEIVTVSEESIIEAMKLIYERMKIIVEPSSAVTLAALIENKVHAKDSNIGLIVSGGNIDLSKLPF